MRKDMIKVIVERERRNRHAEDWVSRGRTEEYQPLYEGMKAGRRRGWNRKELNENLNPLKRYLRSQVGRKWDAVFSDICAVIDTRSTVKQHVRDHIGDFVVTNVHRRADGALVAHGRVVHLVRSGLYVDPDDGILRDAGRGRRFRFRNPFAPREDYIPFGYERAYHRLDGIWYEVFYTLLPDTVKKKVATSDGRAWVYHVVPYPPYDVVAHKWATPSLGKNRYAHAKRQLTTKELKAAGLRNLLMGDSCRSRRRE